MCYRRRTWAAWQRNVDVGVLSCVVFPLIAHPFCVGTGGLNATRLIGDYVLLNRVHTVKVRVNAHAAHRVRCRFFNNPKLTTLCCAMAPTPVRKLN